MDQLASGSYITLIAKNQPGQARATEPQAVQAGSLARAETTQLFWCAQHCSSNVDSRNLSNISSKFV